MARPPPRSVAEDLIYVTHGQERTKVPECYVELYHAFMSVRNNSLSWNYWLRCILSQLDMYQFDLNSLKDAFGGDNGKGVDGMQDLFPCLFIVGENDTFIDSHHIKVIEDQFGKPAVVVPNGGHLPWHEASELVSNELITMWK